MNTVCLTCGDQGDTRLLILCAKCHDSAVHSYCMDNYSPSADVINWTCWDCEHTDDKVEPFRRSQRINTQKDTAVEVRIIWKKKLHLRTEENKEIMKSKSSQSVRGSLFSRERAKKIPSSNENQRDQEVQKQRRRLILYESSSSDEEELPTDAEVSSSTSQQHSGPLDIAYSKLASQPAQPVINPIWRGCFNITCETNEASIGIIAYLSTKACSKVSDTAITLPPVLSVEILAIEDMWPKSFKSSPPTDSSIGLYFFPEYESDEQVFDGLLEDIIEDDLGLLVTVEDVELLIFSSCELPQDHWRFRRKYYLWGTFRQKHYGTPVPSSANPAVISGSNECATPCKLINQAGNSSVHHSENVHSLSPHGHEFLSPSCTQDRQVTSSQHLPFLAKSRSSSPHSQASSCTLDRPKEYSPIYTNLKTSNAA